MTQWKILKVGHGGSPNLEEHSAKTYAASVEWNPKDGWVKKQKCWLQLFPNHETILPAQARMRTKNIFWDDS